MQEAHSYSPTLKGFTYSQGMTKHPKLDPVRAFILSESEKQGVPLSEWSKSAGKNHAYLQQFIRRGVPQHLPEKVRKMLSRAMKVAESRLMSEIEEDWRSEDVAATMPTPRPEKTVKLKGYVGAGSEAHFYAISDEDYEEVEAPANATDKTVAVEIRGTSWGPLMNSWLVFYDDVRSPVTEDLIGTPCVIGLADDRIVIKQIMRNRTGGFDLISNSTSDPPIEDAQIEWAAKVKDMRPRR